MYRTSPSIGALIGLLQTQQARFDAFLALLAREREAIKSLAPTPLVELSQAKLTLLEEIQRLEEQRAEMLTRIAGTWAVPADSLTLRAIAERVGPIESARLLRLREDLHKAVAAIREATGLNEVLLARSLEFLSEGLGVWRSAPKASSLYSSHGNLRSGHQQGTLVRQKG